MGAFVPLLKKSKEPSVMCTVASIGGLIRTTPQVVGYESSKHAAVALTEGLSMELATRHAQIRVHVCCPCFVNSGLLFASQMNKTAAQGESVSRFDMSVDDNNNSRSMPADRAA